MFDQEMPKFSVVGQFIKDVSFENLVSRELPQAGQEPVVRVDADVEYRPFTGIAQMSQNAYETVLKVTATMTLGERNLFIAEVEYVGIVQFEKEYQESQVEPVVYIEIPYYLFFEARNLIASLATQAGFGPVFLRPVDFTQVYMSKSKHAQKMAEQMAAAGQGGPINQ
jgi:preprotein translocase subunit SecB